MRLDSDGDHSVAPQMTIRLRLSFTWLLLGPKNNMKLHRGSMMGLVPHSGVPRVSERQISSWQKIWSVMLGQPQDSCNQ